MSNKEITIDIDEAPSLFFDFARHYHGGQYTVLYRIGSSGTMYVSDIEHVEEKLAEANERFDDPEYQEGLDDVDEWFDILNMVEDELRELRKKYL